MEPTITQAKRAMRETIGMRVRAMTDATRAVASGAIVEALVKTRAFARARTVVGFWPLSDEPDVRSVLDRARALSKRVCFPRMAGTRIELVVVDDLRFAGVVSGLGVWEPSGGSVIPLSEVDLVLAPGIAFDAHGGRLGRGKGFFDRLLQDRVPGGAGWVACGVCFGTALVDAVPREAHDAMVDAVATEHGVSPVSPESAPLWATGHPDR